MAIKKSDFDAYENSRSNSTTDIQGAKDATVSGNGGGISFNVGDKVKFDTVTGVNELDIRHNTSLSSDGTYTCTGVLTRKDASGSSLVEMWPSTLGRTIPEYNTTGAGAFIPTGNNIGYEPPMGYESNAYKFWSRFKGKTLECKEVKTVNTLSFQGNRLVSRKVYKWEVVG